MSTHSYNDPNATIRDDQLQSPMAWWETTPSEAAVDCAPPQLTAVSLGDILNAVGWTSETSYGDGPRYSVQRPLGAGAGGTVWAVHDQRLDRDVAIKVMARGQPDRLRALDTFLAEARIAASLSHPNVLPVHELEVTADGDPCFIMQRIDGMSLGDALRDRDAGNPPPVVANINSLVSVCIAVGQALAYAHHHGVVHRDVKPDNILIGRFGEVWLVDWGCAVRGSATSGRLSGTPLYMSPEQARREESVPVSDVYCLGASIFHALIGRPPLLPGTNVDYFWQRKRVGGYEKPTAEERRLVPPALLAIVEKMIHSQVDHRYHQADAVVTDLQHYQSGLAVAAYRESLGEVLARWYRRNRVPTWTAAVALVLVLAAGSAFWYEKSREFSTWQTVAETSFDDSSQVNILFQALSRPSGPATPEYQAIDSIGDDERVRLDAGELRIGSTADIVNVVTKRRFVGDLKVEWTASALWTPNNLNCFIGSDRVTGYTFHMGGWEDPTYCALTRGNVDVILQQKWLLKPIESNVPYRFRLERQGGYLRLWINNDLIIDYYEPNDLLAISGQSFGFDTWSGFRLGIDDVTISTRPLPERISPLEGIEGVIRTGQVDAAIRMFDDLATAYPDREPGITAAFRSMTVALQSDVVGRATDRQVRELLRKYPDHPQSPYLVLSLHQKAQRADDALSMTAARELMAPYRTHSACARLCAEIGRNLSRRYAQRAVKWDQPRFPDDFRDQSLAVWADYSHWLNRYELPLAGNAYFESIVSAMLYTGWTDLIPQCMPPQSQLQARHLMAQGAFAEAYQRYGYVTWVNWTFLEIMGRFDELITHQNPGVRYNALLQTGRIDQLREQAPHSGVYAQYLIQTGQAESVMADPDFSASARALAALMLGRYAEATAIVDNWSDDVCVRAQYHLDDLGRCLQTPYYGSKLPFLAAMNSYRRGDVAEMEGLLAGAEIRTADHSHFDDILLWYSMPAMLRQDNSLPERLAAAMKATSGCNGLQTWYICRYALGLCDDDVFIAQPYHREVEIRLAWAKALRAELVGDPVATSTAWRAYLEQRGLPITSDWAVSEVAQWRLEVLAAKVP